MSRKSAGLLMYCFQNSQLEVLIVHPGGPYWEKKDLDSWSIPKGVYTEGEDAFATAKSVNLKKKPSMRQMVHILAQLEPLFWINLNIYSELT